MEGRAELWYPGHVEKRREPSWAELIVVILERFKDLDYERVVSEFNQFYQETIVYAYLHRFEELEAQMLIFNKNLGEEFFMMKFIRHKCKVRYSYMLMNEEEVQPYEEENEQVEEQGEEAEIEDVTLSLNAMRGNVSSGTLRVKGMVNGKEKHILIDSGSTHSFIDEKVANALGIKTELTTPMIVSVADGYRMMSKEICPQLSWEIQGFQFSYPVRTLKLGRCDFLLGCDWLGAHNLVELDFHQLIVTISQKDGR
ncbi:UNVERIFIED_CONTAM: hypothetical protein Sradi_3964400 [Sesamum radiatum]|uniref:Retrotransposon gag domain-containing protein n=1 Tax=Sesamum radiatum TaxID=300843 RepID=A0AAW2PG98_SESRA